MELYQNENGEIIVVEEGQTLEATLNSPDYNEGCEVRLNGDIAEYYIAGNYISSTVLTPVGYRKVDEGVEGWIIRDGDQWALAVHCDGYDGINGCDSVEDAVNRLNAL